MADAKGSKRGDTSDREIVTQRLFDAPRELVFRAWTEAEQIGEWFGPNGFTITTNSMEVKPGGVWRFVMHGPDGRDYENKITYEKVDFPEFISYAHGGITDGHEDVPFHTTVTFEDQDGKTLLTMRAVLATPAERDRVIREFGADEGGKQTFARLAEFLATLAK